MLFYFDQRIRKEGFDIEWMMQQAGLAPSTTRIRARRRLGLAASHRLRLPATPRAFPRQSRLLIPWKNDEFVGGPIRRLDRCAAARLALVLAALSLLLAASRARAQQVDADAGFRDVSLAEYAAASAESRRTAATCQAQRAAASSAQEHQGPRRLQLDFPPAIPRSRSRRSRAMAHRRAVAVARGPLRLAALGAGARREKGRAPRADRCFRRASQARRTSPSRVDALLGPGARASAGR